MSGRYSPEALRQWADLHGHTDDYAKCHGCGKARQDCEGHDDDDDDGDPEPRQCSTCGGSGEVTLTSSRYTGAVQYNGDCDDCGGTGRDRT